MAVYIDPEMTWLKNKNWRWSTVTHLYADTLQELHYFANQLGLKREWFQDRKDLPHYDLNSSRRKAAIKLGVIQTTRQHLVRFMRANRNKRLLNPLQ